MSFLNLDLNNILNGKKIANIQYEIQYLTG